MGHRMEDLRASLGGPPGKRRIPPTRPLMIMVCLGASLALLFARPESAESCGGCGRGSLAAAFVRTFTNDDGIVDRSGFDPSDDGTDPGYDKAVAWCEARIVGPTRLRVTMANTYPSYTCTLWGKIRNVGSREIRYRGMTVRAPAALTVKDLTPVLCGPLKVGKSMEVVFSVHVEQAARQASFYSFDIDLRYEATSCKP